MVLEREEEGRWKGRIDGERNQEGEGGRKKSVKKKSFFSGIGSNSERGGGLKNLASCHPFIFIYIKKCFCCCF